MGDWTQTKAFLYVDAPSVALDFNGPDLSCVQTSRFVSFQF